MRSLAILIALTACSKPPPPPPTPLPPLVVEVPEPQPPAALPKPVVSVAREYRAALVQEKLTVLAPDATPDSVRAIHQADIEARNALQTLEAQGHHPTPTALKAARDAVRRLSDVLNSQ
jgi:hypothetical protein